MTPTNRRVLAVFLGLLALFPACVIAWDVRLYADAPPGSTISWSMALLGADSPIAVYAIGAISGGFFIGLPIHFWFGMMRPADRDAWRADKATIARQDAAIAELGAVIARMGGPPP